MAVVKLLDEAAHAIRKKIGKKAWRQPKVGVVLGSALGDWADALSGCVKFPYKRIPAMPEVTVDGHSGNLCIGNVGSVTVACLQGRVHLYEGHPPDKVVFGARLLAHLGCRAVLLTNAAGGINTSFAAGDLMLLTDHINWMGTNPLVGRNIESLGPRFPDMTYAHDPRLLGMAREAAAEVGFTLKEGVYIGLLGPSYETPAEVRMLRTLGADAVGMSTVPELIALRHQRVPAAAVSSITNMAAGITRQELSHEEVKTVGRASRDKFLPFLSAWVKRAAELPDEEVEKGKD